MDTPPASAQPPAAPTPRLVGFPPTWSGVIFALTLFGLGVIVVITQDALAPYIFALILVFLMNGIVDGLARRGLPRWAGTLIALLSLIAGVVLFVYFILSALIEQFVSLAQSLPDIAAAMRDWLLSLNLPPDVYQAISDWVNQIPDTLPSLIPQLLGAIFTSVGSVAGVFVAVAALPFWIFYALSDSPSVMRGLRYSVPAHFREATFDIIGIVGDVFGAWARGQATLSLIVGVPFFLGFTVFGWLIDPAIGQYALLFAVTLALAEFIPIIGSVIAIIPILIITLAISGPTGFFAVLIYWIVISQIEGAVFIPRVQGSKLNLHPVVILPALAVGSALAGLMGAILALPVAAAVRKVGAYLQRRVGGADPETPEPVAEGT